MGEPAKAGWLTKLGEDVVHDGFRGDQLTDVQGQPVQNAHPRQERQPNQQRAVERRRGGQTHTSGGVRGVVLAEPSRCNSSAHTLSLETGHRGGEKMGFLEKLTDSQSIFLGKQITDRTHTGHDC